MSTSPESAAVAAGRTLDAPRLYRHLFKHSPLALVVVEGAGHVVADVNPAFERLTGCDPIRLIGLTFADAAPRAARDCLALLDRVRLTGAAETLAEQRHGGTSPSYWSYAAWATPADDGRPAGVVLQMTDSTEAALFRLNAVAMNEALLVSGVRQHELIEAVRRGEQARQTLEAQMLHAQKLESLGVMAGGIAHDLNNILTPVIGFADLARDALPPDSPAAPMLSEVSVNARRAADLAMQILAYAGKAQFFVRPVDLPELVRGMGGLLAATSGRAVLRYDLAEAVPTVVADATQLRQVVLNLVTNAAEAVGPGGEITLAVRTMQVGDKVVWSAGLKAHLPAGPYVALEVVDTGCGMEGEVLARVFDPFFSTKFVGRGLGLAAVQGIAHGHGGVIRAESELGRGSTFRLLVPSAAGSAAPAPDPPRTLAGRGVGVILVIDDDDIVRRTTTRILERAGFVVIAAGSGEEGLDIARERPQEVDAVVTDLTMPGMGGLETVAALRGMCLDLPAVVMSGYSAQVVGGLAAGHDVAAFVQKPFAPADLVAAVKRAVGR